ncbi:hypothetical protein [Microbacterium sp. NIBRBAC000506063]|uniref:hypothetical protein n=1 Tax=Microbacterium sp. NIBRBAC000506063 TaxID=2734618 RepID=UPI001CB6D029|nr:hypothetical protein [Microbacterium sp. NIBRBAC000506063]
MADELRDTLRTNRDVVVADLNTLMLKIAGLDENPSDAGRQWYTEELPRLAIAALAEDPSRGAYDAICVDEFQDIAGFPAVLDLLLALSSTGSATGVKLAFAGDARQQILRPAAEQVDPYAVARERVPDLVHVALRRGLRQVSGLAASAENLLSRRFGYLGHRVTSTIDKPLAIKNAADASEAAGALAEALRELLKEHQAHDIVVLSPFGEHRSLVGRLLAAEHFTKEERWLRERLRPVSGEGLRCRMPRHPTLRPPRPHPRPRRRRAVCAGARSSSTRASTRRPWSSPMSATTRSPSCASRGSTGSTCSTSASRGRGIGAWSSRGDGAVSLCAETEPNRDRLGRASSRGWHGGAVNGGIGRRGHPSCSRRDRGRVRETQGSPAPGNRRRAAA